MSSAFEFYMPQIDFTSITSMTPSFSSKNTIKKSNRKLRQETRLHQFIINKWHDSYTYKLLMYAVQNVNHYNIMYINAFDHLEVVNNHIRMGLFTESNNKLLFKNLNKFTSMKQELINMEEYINQLKNELYKIVYTSTYLFREHKKEVLVFVNSPLNIFAY